MSETIIAPGATLGILGGGQLGRMIASAAARLGLKVHVFNDTPASPAFALADVTTCAPFTDEAALTAFAQSVDVATYEFENVPREAFYQPSEHGQEKRYAQLMAWRAELDARADENPDE